MSRKKTATFCKIFINKGKDWRADFTPSLLNFSHFYPNLALNKWLLDRFCDLAFIYIQKKRRPTSPPFFKSCQYCYQTNMWRKLVMMKALKKSIKREPTKGTTKNALSEGPLAPVKVSMLAIALGVAPIPKPQ